jgi:hypothetical protein
MKRLTTMILIGWMLVGSSGCALLVVAAAAAAGVAYVKGELQVHIDADPRTLATASQAAFEALEVSKISSAASALDLKIVGRTAGDKKIELIGTRSDAGGTDLSIRVGTFGDESISRQIHEQIKKHLPAKKP